MTGLIYHVSNGQQKQVTLGIHSPSSSPSKLPGSFQLGEALLV